MNGEYEYVVEKQDIVGDGLLDSYKYGSINDQREIVFHTISNMSLMTHRKRLARIHRIIAGKHIGTIQNY